jgi:putative transposase
VRDMLGRDVVTERRACRVLGQARNTQRRRACTTDGEPQLAKRIVWMASEYGRYGYRRITALLRAEGWWVNHKRVERDLASGGPESASKAAEAAKALAWRWVVHPAAADVPESRLDLRLRDGSNGDGRSFRMLTIVDEFTRECLAIDVGRKLTSEDVLERLSDLFVRKGVPDHIRSDNGSEFTAKRVREWLERVGVKTLYIEPGSPWENGYIESFNGKLRDELLAREVFDTLLEAKVLIERWRKAYNTVRPHSSLGYRPPAPESRRPLSARFGYASASGQGRSLGRATLVIETGSIHGGRSPERGLAPATRLCRPLRDQ